MGTPAAEDGDVAEDDCHREATPPTLLRDDASAASSAARADAPSLDDTAASAFDFEVEGGDHFSFVGVNAPTSDDTASSAFVFEGGDEDDSSSAIVGCFSMRREGGWASRST